MNKQGLIALLIFLGSVTVVCAVGLRIYRTTALPLAASGQCYALEVAIELFHETIGSFPDGGTNQAIIKELQPSEERPMDFLFLAYKKHDIYVTLDRATPDQPWVAVDVWKTPLRIELPEGGPVRVTSAGPDREFGTDDDVTSERARQAEAEAEAEKERKRKRSSKDSESAKAAEAATPTSSPSTGARSGLLAPA